MTTKPPTGWAVELLGLAAAVQFTNHDSTRRLIWCDGEWYREARSHNGRWVATPAPGVPHADTMQEARRVGCAFLYEFEAVPA